MRHRPEVVDIVHDSDLFEHLHNGIYGTLPIPRGIVSIPESLQEGGGGVKSLWMEIFDTLSTVRLIFLKMGFEVD